MEDLACKEAKRMATTYAEAAPVPERVKREIETRVLPVLKRYLCHRFAARREKARRIARTVLSNVHVILGIAAGVDSVTMDDPYGAWLDAIERADAVACFCLSSALVDVKMKITREEAGKDGVTVHISTKSQINIEQDAHKRVCECVYDALKETLAARTTA